MVEKTETNAILGTLSKSLNSLLKKYDKMIDNGDSGGALNVLKNIEMIITVIRDISENQTLSKVLNDMAKCWGDLDNQEEIKKSLTGKKDFEITTAMIEKLKILNQIEGICINENIYYCESLADKSIDCGLGTNPVSYYKRLINTTQFKGKTYKNTIIETNNKEIK